MFYAIEWKEECKLARRIQFNSKEACIKWCEKHAPELLAELQ